MLPKHAYYHAFNLLDGIGNVTLAKLLRLAPDIATAWEEFPLLIKQCVSQNRAQTLIGRWRSTDVVNAFERLNNSGIAVVIPEQDSYPALLRRIHQPPIILYYRGLLALPPRALTVVGTRKMSSYGRRCIDKLIPPLAAAGFGIVSGLAYGVDAACHEVALAHGMYTLAVLASGVDVITPAGHERLAQRILDAGGGIASEMPPGRQPFLGSFPRRNRILAGLTAQTVVIEADVDSGSLITAQHALNENRDVGAVPGAINSAVSIGCHQLLRDGARLICGPDDILQAYNVAAGSPRFHPSLTEAERVFTAYLEASPLTLDQIMAKSGSTASEALAVLATLELKGAVHQQPGQGYALSITIDT